MGKEKTKKPQIPKRPYKRKSKTAEGESETNKSSKSDSALVDSDKKFNLEFNYLPEELLLEIFCFLDHRTLLCCQLVCKRWKSWIQRFVWYKKAQKRLSYSLSFDERIPWLAYYFICTEIPFKKNLIKNHSGEEGTITHWKVPLKDIEWFVESPPIPPLPSDSLFNEQNHCFVTSHKITWKYQIVDLYKEGFSKYLLDHLQPTIEISELYCTSSAPTLYLCNIEFIRDDGEKKLLFIDEEDAKGISDQYIFSKMIEQEEENEWLKFKHEFKNYGRGLRKIKFIHGGKDKLVENIVLDDYSCKMARACIRIDIPSLDYDLIAKMPDYY